MTKLGKDIDLFKLTWPFLVILPKGAPKYCAKLEICWVEINAI